MAAAPSALGHDPLICPVCGGVNPPDAVFCGNPACQKALGDFRYVLEELRAETRWYETIAQRVAQFIGRPHFIVFHLFWFGLWVALNVGLISAIAIFDQYPFNLLGILLAVEAVFITGFLLIADNREDAHANKLAELDYEVNVRTYRRLQEIDAELQLILERLEQRDE